MTDKPTAAELKPCPFCGKSGDIEQGPASQASGSYCSFRGWCDHCCFGLEWTTDEREAIAAWNQRAQPSADGLADDTGPIGDAARRIASYCEGDARINVYRKAKMELAALRTRQPVGPEALAAIERLEVENARLREARAIAFGAAIDACSRVECRNPEDLRTAIATEICRIAAMTEER